MGFPAANNLNSPDASLIGRIAALEKRVSAACSGVPIGKVVFASAQCPTSQANFSGTQSTSVAVSIPNFATLCSYIFVVNALGTWNGSGTQYLFAHPEVVCGDVDQTVYRNTAVANSEARSASVSSTLTGTFAIPDGQSQITLNAWAQVFDSQWSGCFLLGNALLLFQY